MVSFQCEDPARWRGLGWNRGDSYATAFADSSFARSLYPLRK